MLSCKSTAYGEPNLVFAGSCARPDKRIGAEVALDVGRDDLSCDAIAKNKPLIRSRHGDYNSSCERRWGTIGKMTLMSVSKWAKLKVDKEGHRDQRLKADG